MDAGVINPLGSTSMVLTSELTATESNSNIGNTLLGFQDGPFKVND
ncbi:hypothetical protein BTURTLESOX_922 [bacterium endosymbiont of Bathymodiolus sp. 5 South]|jgi:hypothetical protein|nr:hypothetical protein BCLUESOX_431 [bacterium endosymbiont of Bathymodiolus sp. 5 South]SSC07869.1 hypothetical protein BTURTLESOX_922 [bacterium endosymbiont of Bathymodiolus sp. 5 South]